MEITLPANCDKFSALNIEKGFKKFKYENDKHMIPLRQLKNEGKSICEANETFLNSAGNMTEELLVLKKINGAGIVSEA